MLNLVDFRGLNYQLNQSVPTTPNPTEMNCNTLPGIKRIEMLDAADLPPYAMPHSICGHPVAIAAPAVEIAFIGRPTLSWSSEKVNGCHQESATLQFTSIHRLDELPRRAFVVTCVNGCQYLIGTREGRFPVVTFEATTGETGGPAAVYTYKITHLAQKSVLPCVL